MKFAKSALLFAAAGSVSALAPSKSSMRRNTRVASAVAVSEPTVSAPVILKIEKREAEQKDVPPEPAASVSIAASATKSDALEPGRYDQQAKSIALPFLKRPSKLDGTLAGDFGFDPLGFSESYDLYTMMEAEIRHARLAMLAVVGWPLSELVAPSWMLQGEYGCAPSVLNGFNPLTFVATLGVFAGFGFLEYKTALRNTVDTPIGRKHKQDMAAVWELGVPGDYNFDPAGLYSSLGDNAVARKGFREVEISHGRMAMLGITGFALWEKLTGHPIVENSMFFHPNLLLPALAAGYVAFNQIYELESDDQYVFQVVKTSEGDARLENVKMSLRNTAEANKEAIAAAGALASKAKDLALQAKEALEEQMDIVTEEESKGSDDKTYFLK